VKYYELVQRGNLRYRSLNRITQPVVEPVSLAEAKAHLRIDSDFSDDDLYVMTLVSAARQLVETICDRTLIRSQWQMNLDAFPSWDIELPRPPIASGDIVVTYTPSDGVYAPVTLDPSKYRQDRDSTPAVIRPPWNSTWPTTRGAENDVKITFWAGYGDSGRSVPPPARHAMLMMLGNWYANRESVAPGTMNPIPMAVDHLLGTINWGQYR
jgi:uncharacterized phiE125 gp8 family phage protein